MFEQGGQVHTVDPKSSRAQVANIRAAGDFPWMMPRWEDVSARMSNIALSPTGRRVVVEARGEIFTIASEGDGVCDLAVVEVTRNKPGWSALCRRIEIFWRLFLCATASLLERRIFLALSLRWLSAGGPQAAQSAVGQLNELRRSP